MSLKAGGTGLTLTAADNVIHLDRWWNPAVEDQATDRAHRLGQRKRSYRSAGSSARHGGRADRQLIENKRALADEGHGGAEEWLAELSTDALAELVELAADSVSELDGSAPSAPLEECLADFWFAPAEARAATRSAATPSSRSDAPTSPCAVGTCTTCSNTAYDELRAGR